MPECKFSDIAVVIILILSQNSTGPNMKIEEIDKNFQAAKVGNLDVCYYDALKTPYELEGFP